MKNTLKHRVLHSGSWVLVGHLTFQLLRFGSNLLLTRLLVPEMFGVMALVTVIIAGLTMLSDIGLMQNIVQSKRGEEIEFINTAWTIQIFRGIIIYVIALIISLLLYVSNLYGLLSPQNVYGYQQLPLILAITSLSALISGFNSTHLFVLYRKIKTFTVVKIDIVSRSAGLVFTLILAYFNRDIWALVYGSLFSATFKMILTHNVPGLDRCRINLNKKSALEIVNFGKWIFLSSILGYLLNQGDRMLLGGFINPELLGIYAIAFFLSNALKDILIKLNSAVFFPVLSETVRDSPENLKRIYYKIKYKVDAISFFFAGFVFSSGEEIINFLYDDRYVQAGWMLQILSLSLLANGTLLSGQIFLANGMSFLLTKLNFILVASFYILFPLFFWFYGITGALWSMVVLSGIRIIISSSLMKKYFFLDIKKEIIMTPAIIFGYIVGMIF